MTRPTQNDPLIQAFQATSRAVMITDSAGQIVTINEAFTDLTDWTAAEVIGQPPSILSAGGQGADFYEGMWQALRREGRWQGELWNCRKDGEFYPEHLKKVTFMQIAPPTRSDVEAYADIRGELEKLSGAINGKYADFDWVPLRYIHRSIERKILAALFRHSEVAFVSPLRDGMNLVAKEYVAAQDLADPGVLVLSKFAGAAETLNEALIINPYDVDEMAHTLRLALTMPLKERVQRHTALFKRVKKYDITYWHQSFLDTLVAIPSGGAK